MDEASGSAPGEDFTTVARRVLDDLHDRVGMETWALSRRDGGHDVVLAARGQAFGYRPGLQRPWPGSYPALVGDDATAVLVADASGDPADVADGPAPAAWLVVPVTAPDGGRLATLTALDPRPCPGLASALGTVQVQAGLLGALLAHELHRADETRRIERAESGANTDPLTRTRNRRGWDAALRAEEGRAARYATAAAVLVVSLDGLGRVNAERGHQAGDAVLTQVAQLLARRLRAVDVLARIGGADFGVILAGTGADGVRAVVDDLRRQLRRAGIAARIGSASRRADTGMLGAWQRAQATRTADPLGPPDEPIGDGARAGAPTTPSGAGLTSIDALLTLAKDGLGMDVAFVNTFDGPQSRFRNLVSSVELPVRAGHVEPREGTYCDLIAGGVLPELTPDVSANPLVADLPVTRALGIGAYVGIPLHRRDGELYGTLCAFSRDPDGTLRDRDTGLLRAIGGVVMDLVEAEERDARHVHDVLERLETLYASGGPDVVYQPIVTLDRLETLGVEALSRFPAGTANPQEWFTSAATAGVGERLEITAARNALAALPRLSGFLAINISPATLVSPGFADVLAQLPLHRIVVEVTEHEAVDDYGTLVDVLRPLRARGLRIAVDDAGAGFASMRHILALVPDFIKLDISLVRGIDGDQPRQALAAALAAFAFKTGAIVIAEGIETVEEFDCLRSLNIDCGQGYHLSRPAPMPSVDAT